MMMSLEDALGCARQQLERLEVLRRRYDDGGMQASVPAALLDMGLSLDEAVATSLPASHAALTAAAQGLFCSLPLAFDPSESMGPYLAATDRRPDGEPYRFLDLGALIASHPFGENDPDVTAELLRYLPFLVGRYAHSEYQTTLSLRFKAALDTIAPKGTPRHFVVNTGAEAVENAIKSVLLNRVKKTIATASGQMTGGAPEGLGLFVISFDGAFHGRTLGSLAVTHRRKARLGFPTFQWPQVSFPVEDTASPLATRRREDKSLEQVWGIMVTGRQSHGTVPRQEFQRLLAVGDEMLAQLPLDPEARRLAVESFVAMERARLDTQVLRRAQRVAGVLIEPIQCEGGLRLASARFFRQLRLLTHLFDVPLMLDEVQTGWGATGRLWAHEWFDLPCPPDIVVWAKKAQNGVLFVSDDLATFFQEEKKFNTTWEGDSVGMLRALAFFPKLDLGQVFRTGEVARDGLRVLMRDFEGLLSGLRGRGVLLGFDVMRADWRDWLRDAAFRRGLILLPAGDQTLRFYPRYDMRQSAIEEALVLLRRALEDLVGVGRREVGEVLAHGPERRPGPLEVPLATLALEDLTTADAKIVLPQIMALEVECYGGVSHYPPGVLRLHQRPLLQYPPEVIASTLHHARSLCLGLRDRVSGRLVAYALGSALENHDEMGVRDDPHFGVGDTFYLQAVAVSSAVKNRVEVEGVLFESVKSRTTAAGFARLSSLIEARVLTTGPQWLREAQVLATIPNYLESGIGFVYLGMSVRASSPEAVS
jgi:4-aminobutyrate aminotransferase-like enzyme